MKQLRFSTLFLLVLSFLISYSGKIQAQAGGTKPELVMYRHNGTSPVLDGERLGTIKWNGLTRIGDIQTGAAIHSMALSVVPGNLQANMIFSTQGAAGLTEHMILTEEGRVGIGTLMPSNTATHDFTLHVIGNTHTSGDFYGRIHFDQSFLDGGNIINNITNNFPPIDYDDEAYFELKNRTVLVSSGATSPGLSIPDGTNPQGGLLSLGPGGSSLDHQLFFGDDGIFTRRMSGNAADWSGAGAGWYKILTSESISGHGGRLPRFTGPIGSVTNTLGDSQLFDDGTNVTIGGNHPPTPPTSLDANYRLTVNGLPTGAARFNGNTYVEGNLGVGTVPSTSTDRLVVSGNSLLDGGARTTGNLGLGTATIPTTNRLEVNGSSLLNGGIRTTGNLGLGTGTIPATNRLEVSGNSLMDGNLAVTGDLDVDVDANIDGDLQVGGSAWVDRRLFVGPVPDPPHAGPLIHQLYVGGSIICTEAKVELVGDWPDYVFEDSYNLTDLNELEKFIQVNKHLPGIPSNAEVDQDGGIELGDMNRRLLEKIEELTLYLIQQQKQIDQQQERIMQLESEIKNIKK